MDYEIQAKKLRTNVLEISNIIGGTHIGGIFSIIDFLLCFYSFGKKLSFNYNNYYCGDKKEFEFVNLIFSKGHCYLAQLLVLDFLFSKTMYVSNYMKQNSMFFGHPKRISTNYHFQVSTGSLGQGVTFANGLAFASILSNNKNKKYVTVLGDGELNEGAVYEAILFAIQHKLNHIFVLDYNKQMSLGKISDILNVEPLLNINFPNFETFRVDGHNFEELERVCSYIYDINNNRPTLIILNTIKGRGVDFMEGNSKWHHRRFKDNEFNDALFQLK